MPKENRKAGFTRLPKEIRKVVDFALRDEAEYENLVVEKFSQRGGAFSSLDFKDCLIKNCQLGSLAVSKLTLINVRLENCDLANLETKELYLRNVEFDKCRLTGLIANESIVAEASFKSCQLNFAQFRFAKIKHVSFDDCLMNEADFYSSQLGNTSFAGCDLTKVTMSKTRHFATDLRTSNIAGIIIDIENLKGITISHAQLYDLVWLLGVNIA